MNNPSYHFDLPQQERSIIKVIGVGGGGSNAVNWMYEQGIQGVDFVVCNTDAQALRKSNVPTTLQIGSGLTEGLGAGANPERGREAARESEVEIREMLSKDTKMVFVTAGMGGGTGTGAAPVIAEIARSLGILTVGIVTAPFAFEGPRKTKQAEKGIAELREHCDTVIVILNEKLREMHGSLPISEAFAQADSILTTAAKGIAEIITVPGYVNVDFEDVKTVTRNSGAAVMGSAETSGDERASRAAREALASPLLNDRNIMGAKKILLSIISGEQAELQMDELSQITEYIQSEAGDQAEVIFGHGMDSTLEDRIRVTVIATGFDQEEEAQPVITEEPKPRPRRVVDLDTARPVEPPTPVEPPPAEPPIVETYDVEEVTPDPAPNSEPEPTPPLVPAPDYRERLRHEAEARQKQYRGARREQNKLQADEIRTMEEPAYQRRNVRLVPVPAATDSKVSRYTLTDDEGLLGNNRFLHDNVD